MTAALLAPALITQINIKLNTRPRSVNFYAAQNDWLPASLLPRRVAGQPREEIMGRFIPSNAFDCRRSRCSQSSGTKSSVVVLEIGLGVDTIFQVLEC